jgi:hypothetical protein
MTESLKVDPSLLATSGAKLRDQVFPTAPPPISAPGTDSVSAAINVTMPIIETPVINGLRDAKVALPNTGTKIAAAADVYQQTDQKLGQQLSQVQFATASEKKPVAATGPRALLGDDKKDDKDKGKDDKSKVKPFDPATMASGLGQMTGMLGQFGGMGSGLMSSAQGAMGGMGAGSSGAKLADDTTKAPDAPADQAQLVNDTKAGDGAARGDQASEAAPTQAGSSADSRSRPV